MLFLSACGESEGASKQVVIYTNADEEPVEVMKKVLDDNGYKDKYILQSFGTSELGGKLMAEGKNSEADLVTMSTYYLTSTQKQESLFKELNLEKKPLSGANQYSAPFTVQEGVIFYNTKVMEENSLSVPTSLKDLANKEYKGMLSISDITQSSTAWLLVQALVDSYGEKEAKTILKGIYENAGDHLESSGSGPLKKVRVGEVALGFGLRHQAIKDKNEGLPIEFVDPSEGTYSLTESLAVIDKGEETNPEAEKMLQLILDKGREDLLAIYPSPLYEGETVSTINAAKNQKVFPEELTAELLEEHKKIVE